MKSTVGKRSVILGGHKTSVSLEDAFWVALKKIAADLDLTLSELVASINAKRQHANLSSALRLFILEFYRDQVIARVEVESMPLAPTAAFESEAGQDIQNNAKAG
jgi:predicted DNA-binding ribbon-helix-helix protein